MAKLQNNETYRKQSDIQYKDKEVAFPPSFHSFTAEFNSEAMQSLNEFHPD